MSRRKLGEIDLKYFLLLQLQNKPGGRERANLCGTTSFEHACVHRWPVSWRTVQSGPTTLHRSDGRLCKLCFRTVVSPRRVRPGIGLRRGPFEFVSRSRQRRKRLRVDARLWVCTPTISIRSAVSQISTSRAKSRGPDGTFVLLARSGFPSHARQHSGDDRRGDFDSRAASSSTSYRPHDLYGGAGGPRGQTRSFEASQAGSGTPYAGRPEEPPTKRPYQPQPQQESSSSSSLFSPSTHAAVGVGGYGPAAAAVPPASASSFSGGSTPQQQRPQHSTASTASSSRLRPPDVGVAPGEGGGAGAGGGPGALDPTTFDATSPASWSTFVNVLRTSHPYFVSLGRMPTLEEVMGLCAPSAMMAFGPGGGTAPPNAAATSRMMTMMTTAMQPGPGAGGPGQAMMGAGGTRGGGMGPGAPPY